MGGDSESHRFRGNIIGDKNPGDLESVYNELAADIHEGRVTSVQQVRIALKPVALSDGEFRDIFARKILPASGRGKRLVRHILCRLEQQLGNSAISDDSRNVTIEHILPENLTPDWEEAFDPDLHQRYVHRLGNVTLLTPSENRDVAQRPIGEKSVVYRRSQFLMTKRLDVEDWEPQSIEQRQSEMAGWAVTAWCF
ncbi:MAG: HNH endonuclease [Verrucomicrobia bacterium]|nr:HNH endonuclease [Verrucomicrobiota bacterium]